MHQNPHTGIVVPGLTLPASERITIHIPGYVCQVQCPELPVKKDSHCSPSAMGCAQEHVPAVPHELWQIEINVQTDGFGLGILLLVWKSPFCFLAAGYWPHSKKWKSPPGWQHGTQPSLFRNPSVLPGTPKHDGHGNGWVHGLHGL